MWWFCSSRVLRGHALTISFIWAPRCEARLYQRSLKMESLDRRQLAVFLVGVLAALAIAVEIARQHRFQGRGRDPQLSEPRISAADDVIGLEQGHLVGG